MLYFFGNYMKKILRFIIVSVLMAIFWPYFLYKKYGIINYKLENKTIIVSNHYSTFDAFFIYLMFRKKKIYFVTITETKKKILSRFLTWLFDCLFIDYNSANVSFFRKTIEILNNDGIICIFPEGEINPRKYGFFDFKASFVYFAKKTNSKILPLYIYPEVAFFKKSKIYIGDVVTPDEINAFSTLNEASMYVQSKIMDYSTNFDIPINLDDLLNKS